MKIFLSYGHDEYENIAQRLKRDLEAEGYDIWIDKEGIKGTADWENAIENGISTSDWLVLLMTEHSVRRPDGVCLDEVSYARFLGKNIAPIMVQDVKPPLCIARIQWIDMKNFLIPGKAFFDEESYQKKKDELLAILKGVQILNVESEQKSLRSKLSPLDNDVYSEHFKKNFYGRTNLISYYDRWFSGEEKVLWLVGDAGIGKTAFIANLCTIRDDIQAVHFCRYNDNERANPKRAIMSIAYYLSTQITEYKEQLFNLQDIDALIEKSTERLFEYLIVEPLCKITYDGDPIVIVIDALDEATVDGRNELADVIAKQFEKTPKWVKLLVTSRKEALLERKLAKIHHIDFADAHFNDNKADITGYFLEQLKDILPTGKRGTQILDKLVIKSEGIFLYAKTIIDEILAGHLAIDDVDAFPEGLTGVYLDYFERIFSNQNSISYKEDVRPVMEVICATYAPLSEQAICDILNIDEYDFEDMYELIYEMFPVKNGVIEPVHKSIIDWLIDPRKSGTYRVSAKRGHGKIADYYFNSNNGKKMDLYAIQNLGSHLLAVDRADDVVELLNDSLYINTRIKRLGLDSAVRKLLFEIEELNSRNSSCVDKIFENETFKKIFAEYRKFFYNSGLYFQLKKGGFDNFLCDEKIYESIDGKIGIAYYYYITENFEKTITLVNQMLETINDLSKAEIEEVHNLIALCYRKYVDFEKAKEHFMLAFESGNDIDTYYNQSISLVNLGKIAYHELDWKAAVEWNKQAIQYLCNELSNTTDEDYKVVLELFIAEYHRLSAECIIWNYDLKRVDEELQFAHDIYDRIKSRDRYYIRYLYTSVFRNILAGEYEEVIEDCDILFEQATSAYDKSQILFYRAIASLKLKKNDECQKNIQSAYNYAKSIGAWLELEEMVMLSSFVCDSENCLEHSKIFEENIGLQKWIEHAKSFIENIPGGR